MNYVYVKKGNYCSIYALIAKNRCPYKDYIEALENKYKTQVIALVNHIAERGTHNILKMRPLREGIYELKTRSGIRIFCFFFENRMLLLTHGQRKPKPNALKIEIDKALALKKQFLDDFKKGLNREIDLEGRKCDGRIGLKNLRQK